MKHILTFESFINEFGPAQNTATLSNTLGVGAVNPSRLLGIDPGTHQYGMVGSPDVYNSTGLNRKRKSRKGQDIDIKDWEEEIYQELDDEENDRLKNKTDKEKQLQKGIN